MCKWLAVLACASVLAIGPCSLKSWDLVLGPVINGETVFGGVELEFNNGVDFIIPISPFDNVFD